MPDDPENHTIRLLQEMRSEIQTLRTEVTEQLDSLSNRGDGNTIILNMIAGIGHDHENRLRKLEAQ